MVEKKNTPSGHIVNISTLKQFQDIPFCKVNGYITAVCDDHWWLGSEEA
jgi:hypothetical protein